MSGCSIEAALSLAAITPQQIMTLVEILEDTTWRSCSFVTARYNERARNFKETLAFLEELGWVQRSFEHLQAAPVPLSRLARAQPGESAPVLAEVLVDSPGPHRETLA